MPDYEQGKIYAIRSYLTEQVYIGSTTSTLAQRMAKHRNHFKTFKKETKNYITSFELMKYDDCYIELVEVCPCNSKIELNKREGEIIRITPCVNKVVAGRTRTEYRIEEKEKISLSKKEYHKKNRDVVLEKIRKYKEPIRKELCEKQKIYYQEHKQQKRHYDEEYRKMNKRRIQDYQKRTYICECGQSLTICKKNRHNQSKKHINYIEGIFNIEDIRKLYS